ncbi:hypothetical protein CWI36_0287p0050 [Hamiltosporidium magnivora]|uniref:Uncharacterized protein n=1 Tax=Hamiltosporidium magnivora TaxID=148818 RepID=A0A4Q9LHV8_9MICR|nr:hypothetical protein CWI36_0287p0050 [Hamiltosporidium magnivora]
MVEKEAYKALQLIKERLSNKKTNKSKIKDLIPYNSQRVFKFDQPILQEPNQEKKENFEKVDSILLTAIDTLLRHSNVTNFSEFLRSFSFKKPVPTLKSLTEQISSPNYTLAGKYLGHFTQISCMCQDENSTFVFTGSEDGNIKMWNIKTGISLNVFLLHKHTINDMCVSQDSQFLASCDSSGRVVVWSLKTYKPLYNMEMESEIEFVQFIRKEEDLRIINSSYSDKNISQDTVNSTYNTYILCLVFSSGVIKTITFDNETTIATTQNTSLMDISLENSLRAVCVTEGYRFLLCGGTFPFLLIFDLTIPENFIVFETGGFTISSVCASRQNLKFAVSTHFDSIIQYSFIPSGTPIQGNFKKKRKEIQGHWKKNIIHITSESYCDRLCYLSDDTKLVGLFIDNSIRLYHNNILTATYYLSSFSSILTASNNNTIAVCDGMNLLVLNQTLSPVYTDTLSFRPVDCLFNKENLVLSDEFGYIVIYSICPFLKIYKKQSLQQFFECEFLNRNLEIEEDFIECNGDPIYDINKNTKILENNFSLKDVLTNKTNNIFQIKNERENKNEKPENIEEFMDIEMTKKSKNLMVGNSYQMYLENMAFEHLKDDFITPTQFKKKYLFTNETQEETNNSESTCLTESSITSDDNIISESTLDEESYVSEITDSTYSKESDIIITTERIVSETFNIELEKYVENWLLGNTDFQSFLPQIGDKLYFFSEKYKEFRNYELREEFNCEFDNLNNLEDLEDCIVEVKDVQIIKYDPSYLQVECIKTEAEDLNRNKRIKNGNEFNKKTFFIKYYDYPNGGNIFLLKAVFDTLNEFKFRRNTVVSVVYDGILYTGKVLRVERDGAIVLYDDGTEEWVGRYDMYCNYTSYGGYIATEMLDGLLSIIGNFGDVRALFVKSKRKEYLERCFYFVTLNLIKKRILNGFYRSIESILWDFDNLYDNSIYLDESVVKRCEEILKEVYSLFGKNFRKKRR